LQELIQALVAKLTPAVSLRTSAEAARVERGEGGYRVVLSSGEALFAHDVVLALSLPLAGGVARGLDPALGGLLDEFRASSTATAFLAYRAEDVPRALDATGFLVPRQGRRSILAATWVSSKWDHRAPPGGVLLRVFFGGATDPGALERDDAELATLARGDLRSLMGIERAPLFTQVFRFLRASPQPRVGHLARVQRVKEHLARWPGLHVTGNGFEGTGIPDCIRFAELTGEAIASRER
jgi:oxygen-dependent protoporphyrinogen oxidase